MSCDTVFVIVLNYKNWQDTVECISAVAASTYKNIKMLVVDNHSENESINEIVNYINSNEALISRDDFSMEVYRNQTKQIDKTIQYSDKYITIIEAARNGGFAYGNNLAINLISNKSGYAFLLNPDMIVAPNTIEKLVESQKKVSAKTISSCTIYDYYNKERKLYSGLVKLNPKTATISEQMEICNDADYVCGGALFAQTTAFREIGLLPEEYFLYWEDADWCYRAKQKGYTLTSFEDTISYDKGGTTIGRGYLAEYYYARNGLMFFDKINSPTWTIVASNLTIRLLKKLLLFQFNRAKALIDGTIAFLKK
jgi:GT2 family glycosyltransferase